MNRISSAEAKLKTLEAKYQKASTTPAGYLSEWTNLDIGSPLTEWGKAISNWIAADIEAANIHAEDLDDEGLKFVEKLVEVRNFELHANLATDATLGIISRLPNLQCLTVVGGRFSAAGLLQLRSHPTLAQLRIRQELYTPIEIATLRSELCGVQVEDVAATEPRYVALQQATLIAQ